MEGEMIIISVITTIGGMFSLWMINQNWFKRQEAKHKYYLKRLTLSKKFKAPPPQQELGALSSLAQILPALKGLDLEQISDLVDRFQQGSQPQGESEADILTDLLRSPIAQQFLKGLSQGGKKDEGEEESHKSQV